MNTRILIATCVAAVLTLAASADDYVLDWSTLDSGGIMDASGSGFTLSATLGQPDAAPVAMSGSGYTLIGGFWPGVVPALPGDCSGNGIIDFADFQILAPCLSGPGTSIADGCSCGDLDGDSDVDVRDFQSFQAAFGHY